MPRNDLAKPLGYAIALAGMALLLTAQGYSATEPASLQKIEDAFKSGRISYSEKLFDEAKAFFAPQDLPADLKSSTPSIIKSGTALVMQIREQWARFTPSQQAVLSAYLNPPYKQFSYDSPDGYFTIHYDLTGSEAVPPQDGNANGVPDYVERIGQYCDSSRACILGNLGYLPPPIDTTMGGDDKYDVYLESIFGYGMTVPEHPGDSVWNDYTSYIAISCRMDFGIYSNDDPDGDTIGAQKVTCAHEYFHAVQLAYNNNLTEYRWLMEASSTWMEEVAYPEVNDNHNYLPYFFSYPYQKLTSTGTYHEYGAFVWPAYLQLKYGALVLRKTWEACRYNTAAAALDSALAGYGTDVAHTFPEFTIWNYYTGSRAGFEMYYPEAADYPQPAVDQAFATLEHESVHPVTGPDGLGCNYVEFLVDSTARGILDIILDGSDLVRWGMASVASGTAGDTVKTVVSALNENLHIFQPFIEDYDLVVVVPAVVSPYVTGNVYALSCHVLPHGDANYDRVANLADAVYLVAYVFRGGPAPRPMLSSGDANCDGSVNLADAVGIINYVFNGGAEPCAER